MITFTTTLHSFSHRAVIGISGMTVSFVLSFLLFPEGQLLLFSVSLVGMLLLTWYLSERFSGARIRLALSEQGLTHTWIKQLPLQNRQSRTTPWSDMTSYTISKEKEVASSLKVELKNGSTLTLDHDNTDINQEDFQRFLQAFTKQVERYNYQVLPQQHIIKGTPFFKTTAGFAAVYALAAIILSSTFYTSADHASMAPYDFIVICVCGYLIYWVHNQEKHVLRDWF